MAEVPGQVKAVCEPQPAFRARFVLVAASGTPPDGGSQRAIWSDELMANARHVGKVVELPPVAETVRDEPAKEGPENL